MRDIHRLPFPFLLILPSIVFFLILFAFPLVQGVGLAFTTREGALTLANFGRMFGEIYFRDAVVYTFLLTTIIVPIQLVLALIIALLVNTRLFGSSKFLYICAIPIAISEIAAGIIWLSIFTGSGYLNILLFRLGLIENRITFLSLETPEYLFLAIVLCEVWRATAIVMIIVVAGLQMIHKDYMDVADVYGASTLQKLRHVTLPLLKPCIKTALIIRTVLAFQVFGTVLALAGRMVPVLAGEAYMAQFFLRDVRLASTYGLLIMAFSTAFVLLYLRLLRTRWTI